jgi:glycosyltransferase involved in cell wall biosynthesis
MYRALATANAFARDGWKVTVLTATRDTFERLTGSDPESEEFIDPRVRVVRVPFVPERDETDLRKWSRARLYSPRLWDYVKWQLSDRDFPERGYGAWMRPLVAAAEQIHREDPVDLTAGTANPNVDFAPGMYLRRTYGIPYVMDHRDAWHLNVHTGLHLGRRFGRSRRLERHLIDDALEVWFVNEPIRAWHVREYPRNAASFHVVANGFDPVFLTTKTDGDTTEKESGGPDRVLIFGYLGTIYGRVPLRETLEGWRRARAESGVISRSQLVFRGRLGHYAEPNAEVAALLEEYRCDGVSYLGPVSKTQVTGVYSDFDALVFIAAHSEYVTSGKVFEYAATGLPIGAFHHPETAATSVLRGYPRVFPVAEPTPRLIADAFIDLAEHTASAGPRDAIASRAWAAHLSRDAQLTPRITALRIGLQNQAPES